MRKLAFLAAGKDAADEAAGSYDKAIEEAAVEKESHSFEEEKGATEEADGSVSKDASEKVSAGKVATKKLAAREHALEKPTQMNRKSSEIFLYCTKRSFGREGKCC